MTTTKTFTLFWISVGSSLRMGDFASLEAAESAIPAARAGLLDECGTDSDRDSINAGTFEAMEIEA